MTNSSRDRGMFLFQMGILVRMRLHFVTLVILLLALYANADEEELHNSCRAKKLPEVLRRVVYTPFYSRFKVDVLSECTIRYANHSKPAFMSGKEVVGMQDAGNVCKLDSEGSPSGMCKVTETDAKEGYVDLLADPEAFTGYPADQSRKIWTSLYRYICTRDGSFLDGDVDDSISVTSITKRYCSSGPLLYRLVSGLHTSISLHICQKWTKDPSSPSKWKGDPLCYMKRIGNDAYKKQNFYLLVSKVERALLNSVHRIENIFDGLSKEEMRNVKKSRKMNEKLVRVMRKIKISDNDDSDALKLSEEEYSALRSNIFRIFDCVECARCKLWGKLQIVGLITTMRILDQYQNKDLNIDKNDLVALVNLANNVFLSAEYICLFENKLNTLDDSFKLSNSQITAGLAVVLVSGGALLFFKRKPRNNSYPLDESFKRKTL